MNYKKHLARDPKLKKFLKLEVSIPKPTKNIMIRLVSSILAQQLSTQVAKVMYQRFIDLFDGKLPTAEQILELKVEDIRTIGVSRSKASYILNVAQFFHDHKLTASKLKKMTNEEMIELLTQIKGVGRWTVEMLLLFGLAEEDIFAVDDLGVQKAMMSLFKLDHLSKKDLRIKMMKLSERWSPYRSYVCLMFWKSTAPKPKKS